MKKIVFYMGLIAMMAVACSKGNETHNSTIVRPSPNSTLWVWADQKWDSIAFVTTESYTLTSTESWCTIPEGREAVHNPYSNTFVSYLVPIQFIEANTTGEGRYVQINVNAGDYSIVASIYQSQYLNITRPSRNTYYPYELNELTVAASENITEVKFTTFDSWTLAVQDGSWITLPTESTGASGSHAVSVTLSSNTGSTERRDTLLLTSRGVTNKIPVLQKKP